MSLPVLTKLILHMQFKILIYSLLMQFLSTAEFFFCGHSPAYSKNVLWKGRGLRTGKRYLKIKMGGLSAWC